MNTVQKPRHSRFFVIDGVACGGYIHNSNTPQTLDEVAAMHPNYQKIQALDENGVVLDDELITPTGGENTFGHSDLMKRHIDLIDKMVDAFVLETPVLGGDPEAGHYE
ncbi:hypothetical protein GO003_018965 [Methylicorpusculum oleiharenae]|uniref:hypothetical protein n=1 Tax=Methylicorpusculum oleiharenae TaxID=1338687 RepID=UPI00135C74D9|nr:hypothetical protein [Methylicorpusculum oleiharenae]MCD2452469.1 hypothetical protein [Methylicorpusculum oleiharenae]